MTHVAPNLYKRAFKGLNSNQITEFIYGSERPSTRIIKESHLIPSFQICNIHAVINLQEKNEHPNYNQLHPNGFSYKFEEFEQNKVHAVKVHSYPIPDFGVPLKNMTTVMDSYYYIYTTPGKYTATFVASNQSRYDGKEGVYEVPVGVQ